MLGRPSSFVAVGIAAVLAAMVFPSLGLEVRAKSTGPCDSPSTHGAYTSYLCDNDDLAAGEYIISPNGDYRFYLQNDGHTLVYDTSGEEWEPTACDLGFVEGASHLAFSATPMDHHGTANVTFYTNGGSQLWFGSAFGNFSGDYYMTLSNSGDLEMRDQGGANLFLNICSLVSP